MFFGPYVSPGDAKITFGENTDERSTFVDDRKTTDMVLEHVARRVKPGVMMSLAFMASPPYPGKAIRFYEVNRLNALRLHRMM